MYTVKNVMSSPVVTIDADAPVSEAMRLMARKDISSLIVTARDGERGIITRRDVVGKVVAAGLDPKQVKVNEICTAPVVTVSPQTSLRECSARMMDLKVRRLPVCDDQNKLVGIVTETDIFMAVEERGWGPDELGESKLRAIGTQARIRRMKVEEVMSKPVAMVSAETPVSEALTRMAERGISSLIVQPYDNVNVYGIVTKRDIIGKVVAAKRDPQKLRVAEIMSSPIYTIAPHVTLPQCAARMVAMGVRRLVVTQDDKPVGIISDTDIFHAVEGKRVSPLDRVHIPRPPIRHITKSQVHTAADVMGREEVYISAEATVSQALATMEAENVFSLIVRPKQKGGELGIVTQRDIISKVVAQERDPDTLQVGEICSAPLITVSPDTSIDECSAIMIQHNIRRLPVKEGHDIIGVVRDTDIFAAVEERGWGPEVAPEVAAPKVDRLEKAEGGKRKAASSKRKAFSTRMRRKR